MESSNTAAADEMKEQCKIVFEEYCRSKKKHNHNNSNRSTTHGHHNNEHYTSGIPVAVPVREKYVSKSKRNRNKKKIKQQQVHLKQQDNTKNLDDLLEQQQKQQKKKNKIEIGEDDTCTVATVPCSNSTLNTYDDTESTSVTISCVPFIENITSNTDESINENHSSQNSNRVSSDVYSSNDDDDNPRVVQFDMNANELYEIESYMTFSNKERSNYWYNGRDKEKTMEKLERLIVKYEKRAAKITTTPSSSSSKKKKKTLQQSSSTSSSYYFSGFEAWTTLGALKLDLVIIQCRNAVMEEQNEQWNDSIIEYEYDHDCDYYDLLQKQIHMIAECSLKVTTESARRAHLKGLEVAQEAQQLLGESWIGKKDSGGISVGSKKDSRKLLCRHDSIKKGRRNMSRRKKKEEDDTLSSMQDNSSSTPSNKILTKKKKNKQKMIMPNNNKEEEECVPVDVAPTLTTVKEKKKKSKNSSKSSTTTTEKSSSSSVDPPGSRLLVPQEKTF